MEEEKFIMEVENPKIIYETTNPFYKDNHKKNKAWNTISAVLGEIGELLIIGFSTDIMQIG